MKKILLIMLLFISVFVISGCEKTEVNEDAKRFKEEYETLNGKTNSSGTEYRKISIDEDNPFVYISAEDVVKKINDKETFYLYVGDKQCPWCRSTIEKLIEVAKKNKIKTIYYVNIWDDNHKEILRDKYVLNDKNKVTLESKGTDAYYQLLEAFNDLLKDYVLTDNKGKSHNVGEKRIFAPNYFYIKDGKATKLTTGISSSQEKSNDELTTEILADEEKAFTEFFKN